MRYGLNHTPTANRLPHRASASQLPNMATPAVICKVVGLWKKAIGGLRRFEKVLTAYAVFNKIRELSMFKVPPLM